MAISKSLIVSLIFSLIFFFNLVQALDADVTVSTSGVQLSLKGGPIDCGRACRARCQALPKLFFCIKACKPCCDKCKCVPKGTGGKVGKKCPCYAKLTDLNGKPMCP